MMRAGFRWALTAAASLSLLWLVFGLYVSGRAAWAAGLLAFGSLAIWIYASSRTLAAKYLFPGVAGMLVFIALPLVYTVQIGFTNYSSAHLLEEDRARAYLRTRLPVGSRVWIRPVDTDRYGRTVAEVIGEINLGLAMVEDGWAFVHPRHGKACAVEEYRQAEFRASRHRYGLWQQPGGIERPWDFRREHRR